MLLMHLPRFRRGSWGPERSVVCPSLPRRSVTELSGGADPVSGFDWSVLLYQVSEILWRLLASYSCPSWCEGACSVLGTVAARRTRTASFGAWWTGWVWPGFSLAPKLVAALGCPPSLWSEKVGTRTLGEEPGRHQPCLLPWHGALLDFFFPPAVQRRPCVDASPQSFLTGTGSWLTMDSSQDGWRFYLHNYSALKAQVLINVLMVGRGFKLLLVIL